MYLRDILRVGDIRTNMSARIADGTGNKTKIEVLHEVIDLLVEMNDLSEMQRESVEKCFLYRERQKSTGMERNVAIPHGKTEMVKGMLTSLLIYPEGVLFDTLDRKPAYFVLGNVSDYEHSTEQVQALAGMMRVLQREEVAQKILAACCPAKVKKILDDAFRGKQLGRI